MAQYQYQLTSGVPFTTYRYVEVVGLVIDFDSRSARMQLRFKNSDGDVVAVRTLSRSMATIDAFGRAASSVPGTTMEQKLLSLVPNVWDVPEGGTVVSGAV